MEETIKNAIENSPHDIQTGPARRGDIKIINKHLRLLSKEVDMKEIYRILSKNIQKEYRKQ